MHQICIQPAFNTFWGNPFILGPPFFSGGAVELNFDNLFRFREFVILWDSIKDL